MLLQGTIHDLCLSTNSPDSHFTFHTSGYNFLAIISSTQGGNTVVVSIVNGIKKLSRLWKEGSDLSIIPSGQDALTILGEVEAVAFKARYFDSE